MSDPYAFDNFDSLRLMGYSSLGLSRRNSHAILTGITDGGPPDESSPSHVWIPRVPFWTRYMLGVREAERDRRRYG